MIICYDDKPISHFYGKEMEQKSGKPAELLKKRSMFIYVRRLEI